MVIGHVDDKEVMAHFGKMPPLIEREWRREVRRTALALEAAYRRNARPHFITGNLNQSISAESDDGWASAIVGSSLLYSIFVEVGTRAHTIEPVFASFLKFFWDKTGEIEYRKTVHHPGTPAFNLLLKAWLQEMEPFHLTMGKRMVDRINQLMEKN